MIKFILDKVRTAPGPMSELRGLAADLAEAAVATVAGKVPESLDPLGILSEFRQEEEDYASYYSGETYESGDSYAYEESAEPADSGTENVAAAADGVDYRDLFDKAVKDKKLASKQEFKVLAILWDAADECAEGLTARELAERSEKLKLKMRPENIRKVLRSRLSDYSDAHEETRSGKKTLVFSLNEKGYEYFREKYLKPLA